MEFTGKDGKYGKPASCYKTAGLTDFSCRQPSWRFNPNIFHTTGVGVSKPASPTINYKASLVGRPFIFIWILYKNPTQDREQ